MSGGSGSRACTFERCFHAKVLALRKVFEPRDGVGLWGFVDTSVGIFFS